MRLRKYAGRPTWTCSNYSLYNLEAFRSSLDLGAELFIISFLYYKQYRCIWIMSCVRDRVEEFVGHTVSKNLTVPLDMVLDKDAVRYVMFG